MPKTRKSRLPLRLQPQFNYARTKVFHHLLFAETNRPSYPVAASSFPTIS